MERKPPSGIISPDLSGVEELIQGLQDELALSGADQVKQSFVRKNCADPIVKRAEILRRLLDAESLDRQAVEKEIFWLFGAAVEFGSYVRFGRRYQTIKENRTSALWAANEASSGLIQEIIDRHVDAYRAKPGAKKTGNATAGAILPDVNAELRDSGLPEVKQDAVRKRIKPL